MTASAQLWLTGGGTALVAAAMTYVIIACIALRVRRLAQRSPLGMVPPPTTVLKPLCGGEYQLYERLRSFCEQSCPELQIIFGVRDPDDPGLEAVRRLQREFPRVELEVVVNPVQHGTSAKVSNLLNMMPFARHEYLVIADADVRVPPDYLARIIAPLRDEAVGIVTCLYRGCPRRGLWSLLGSLFVNEWFKPSVCVAALFGSRAFAFGATIALRRDTLTRIGGFGALADQLPDDYRLGELTRQLGLRTVLSEVEVETGVDEASLGELVQHELRWLRTIRTVRPLGYALAGVSFGLPVAIVGGVLAGAGVPVLVMVLITAIGRLMIASGPRKTHSSLAQLWLVVLSDLLGFALWCWSFTGRRVHWRHARYRVARDGTAHPIPR